ncbi:hypothetical protein V5799_022018 [Amblyomma americanum]|uniref:Uncharacterized protein n=1 Tax=Amblyomma americanum TaxID=6943 RepID=A0AAQ4FLR4_AMBAM
MTPTLHRAARPTSLSCASAHPTRQPRRRALPDIPKALLGFFSPPIETSTKTLRFQVDQPPALLGDLPQPRKGAGQDLVSATGPAIGEAADRPRAEKHCSSSSTSTEEKSEDKHRLRYTLSAIQ